MNEVLEAIKRAGYRVNIMWEAEDGTWTVGLTREFAQETGKSAEEALRKAAEAAGILTVPAPSQE